MVYMDSLSGRFQDSALARYLSVTIVYSVFLCYQLAVAINLLACIMVLCAYFEVCTAGCVADPRLLARYGLYNFDGRFW